MPCYIIRIADKQIALKYDGYSNLEKFSHKSLTLTTMKYSTALFYTIDDFFLKFESIYRRFLKQNNPYSRIRQNCLSLPEIVYIAVWYKPSHMDNFQAFYQLFVLNHKDLFKVMLCYKRMVYNHQLALQAFHFALMQHQHLDLFWINSTPLSVCRNQRTRRHKSCEHCHAH